MVSEYLERIPRFDLVELVLECLQRIPKLIELVFKYLEKIPRIELVELVFEYLKGILRIKLFKFFLEVVPSG